MRKKLTFLTLALGLYSCSLVAQYSGPRLFLDVPALYAAAPDVQSIGNRVGAGAEIAMNVATHWATLRGGGGATVTINPQAEAINKSFVTTPYLILQAGIGLYRSNGNQCAKTKQSAFTAIGKAGLRYDIYTGNLRPANETGGKLDYTLGAEFGYFFISDIFRNNEFFIAADYLTQSKIVSANLGFKFFLNMRAIGDR